MGSKRKLDVVGRFNLLLALWWLLALFCVSVLHPAVAVFGETRTECVVATTWRMRHVSKSSYTDHFLITGAGREIQHLGFFEPSGVARFKVIHGVYYLYADVVFSVACLLVTCLLGGVLFMAWLRIRKTGRKNIVMPY